jgi:hypothetical protein
LNGIEIANSERKGAEIDYLKKFGSIWVTVANPSEIKSHQPILDTFVQNHPRYHLLVDSKYYL